MPAVRWQKNKRHGKSVAESHSADHTHGHNTDKAYQGHRNADTHSREQEYQQQKQAKYSKQDWIHPLITLLCFRNKQLKLK